jgi:hypothetical protein
MKQLLRSRSAPSYLSPLPSSSSSVAAVATPLLVCSSPSHGYVNGSLSWSCRSSSSSSSSAPLTMKSYSNLPTHMHMCMPSRFASSTSSTLRSSWNDNNSTNIESEDDHGFGNGNSKGKGKETEGKGGPFEPFSLELHAQPSWSLRQYGNHTTSDNNNNGNGVTQAELEKIASLSYININNSKQPDIPDSNINNGSNDNVTSKLASQVAAVITWCGHVRHVDTDHVIPMLSYAFAFCFCSHTLFPFIRLIVGLVWFIDQLNNSLNYCVMILLTMEVMPMPCYLMQLTPIETTSFFPKLSTSAILKHSFLR